MSTTEKSKRRKTAVICVAGFLFLFVVWTLFASFHFMSVCVRCGADQTTFQWQVPRARQTVFSLSWKKETPVSASLERAGIAGRHAHEWLFNHGGGNGVTCALGHGSSIYPTVHCQGVARVIEASHQFGETNFCDRVVRLMFDPKTSGAVWQLGRPAPTNGFASATEFRDWLGQRTEYFEDLVTQYQKRP